MASEPTPASESQAPRDAIIFIPAIGTRWSDQITGLIASRIRRALENAAPSAAPTFAVSGLREIPATETNQRTRMYTVSRHEGEQQQPLVDVWELDYGPTLRGTYDGLPLFLKALVVFATIVGMIPTMLFALARRGKTWGEKLQLVYALFMLFLVSAYAITLFAALVELVLSAMTTVSGAPAAPSTPTTGLLNNPAAGVVQSARAVGDVNLMQVAPASPFTAAGAFFDRFRPFYQQLVVFIAAVSTLLPARADVAKFINEAAINYLCMAQYLALGRQRNAVLGQLQDMLNYLEERYPQLYPPGRVHIMGYSFGSILAMDGLFPPGEPPGPRLAKIGMLVTIGCPYDVIRLFWPNYFKARQPGAQSPDWLNVYSSADILGSNFDNHGGIQDPSSDALKDTGLPTPRNIPFAAGSYREGAAFVLDFITLNGFRAHATYWDSNDAMAKTCFDALMKEMYYAPSAPAT